MSVAAVASIAVVSALVGLGTGFARKYVLLLVLSILTALVVEGLLAKSSTGFFSTHEFGDSIAQHLIIAVITSSLVYLSVAFLRAVFAAESNPGVATSTGVTLDKASGEMVDLVRFKKQAWLINAPLFFMPLMFFVVPVITLLSWLYFRRQAPVLRFAATEALTLSVTWALILFLYAVFIVFGLGYLELPDRYVQLGMFLASLIPAVFAFYAAMQVSNGRLMRFPLNLRFISAPNPAHATDLPYSAGAPRAAA